MSKEAVLGLILSVLSTTAAIACTIFTVWAGVHLKTAEDLARLGQRFKKAAFKIWMWFVFASCASSLGWTLAQDGPVTIKVLRSVLIDVLGIFACTVGVVIGQLLDSAVKSADSQYALSRATVGLINLLERLMEALTKAGIWGAAGPHSSGPHNQQDKSRGGVDPLPK